MAFARVTLFDLDGLKDDEDPVPTAQAVGEFNPDDEQLAYRGLKVTISCGDPVCGSSLTIPFGLLSTLMAAAMEEHARKEALKPPKIIMPGFMN